LHDYANNIIKDTKIAMKKPIRCVAIAGFFTITGALVGTIFALPLCYHFARFGGRTVGFYDLASTAGFGFCLLGLPSALVTGLIYLLGITIQLRYFSRPTLNHYAIAGSAGLVPLSALLAPSIIRNPENIVAILIPVFFGICSIITAWTLNQAKNYWPLLNIEKFDK